MPATAAASPPFSTAVRTVGPALVVEMHGELDLATADLARAELAAADSTGTQRLVVDLSDVGLLDSTGLAVLIAASRRDQGEFALLCPGGLQARGVLSLSGALDHMTVFDSEEELREQLPAAGEATSGPS